MSKQSGSYTISDWFHDKRAGGVLIDAPYWDMAGYYSEETGWAGAFKKMAKSGEAWGRKYIGKNRTQAEVYTKKTAKKIQQRQAEVAAMYASATWDKTFSPEYDSHVARVEYSTDRRLLRVTWKNARTGGRGAPPGSITVYDHVGPGIFSRLQDCARGSGMHVGEELWHLLRVRGGMDSRYLYAGL